MTLKKTRHCDFSRDSWLRTKMMHFPFAAMQGLIVKQRVPAFPETTYYNIM